MSPINNFVGKSNRFVYGLFFGSIKTQRVNRGTEL
jgi:hypothetical protein